MPAMTYAQAPGKVPGTILVVEDNPIIAMNTEALLLDMGVGAVHCAAGVAEALALIGNMPFDFAILDFRLGDAEDSLPVAERLAQDGVALAFATGLGEDLDLPAPFAEAPVLRKPYSSADLQALIGRG